MSKNNPLAGLIGYGDSDEDSEEESPRVPKPTAARSVAPTAPAPAGVHPPPVAYCPWSACYDETSGFTYYWNQQTNAVTWDAPPEYLLALKLAQQHMNTAGSTEVSAEEWQLYQQALAEKQNAQNKTKTLISKPVVKEPVAVAGAATSKEKIPKGLKRRRNSEDEKIELITSYHNSDSESNDDESPVKQPSTVPKAPVTKPKEIKKPKKAITEYGPALPPNQNYTVPIGPEIPLELLNEKVTENVDTKVSEEPKNPAKKIENDDLQDDDVLLMKLKDKAKLLEKLGGEIPTELQKIIQEETRSRTASPKNVEENSRDSKTEPNIDDLLDEIEKKELPKIKSKNKVDIFSSNPSSQTNSLINSPRSNGDQTPPIEDFKPLFPSSKNIIEEVVVPSVNDENVKDASETLVAEKKGTNLYLMDTNEPIGNTNRKKLRISNSVLPDRKKAELPAYTTKYSHYIDGFSNERTGLGFSKEEDSSKNPKNTVSYGNGLVFTKGETLNEDKKDDDLDDVTDLVEAKLKYLNSLQIGTVNPVQEMLIQMQTLGAAFRSGALSLGYWARWVGSAASALRRREADAAPQGWSAVFQRCSGRYRYRREADGLEQWEYPATADTDMDICTTPPHPHVEEKEEIPPPPPPPPPPAPPSAAPRTPPPPSWHDPPPPGCDDPPPPPPPPPLMKETKQEIGDELLSFYNDIAEIEKSTVPPPPPSTPPIVPTAVARYSPDPPAIKDKYREKEKAVKDAKEDKGLKTVVNKKKSKVKISSSIGMKQKSVSTLVAKWQQVADEINSD